MKWPYLRVNNFDVSCHNWVGRTMAKTIGLLCTQSKDHDYKNLRALKNHPKAVPWKIEI